MSTKTAAFYELRQIGNEISQIESVLVENNLYGDEEQTNFTAVHNALATLTNALEAAGSSITQEQFFEQRKAFTGRPFT